MTSTEERPSAVAATISGRFDPPLSAEEAGGRLSRFLSEVTVACAEAGASMIGHVKANVRSGGEMMSMGSTTEDGNVRTRSAFSSPVSDYDMTLNVIVYGIGEDVISDIVTGNAKAMGARHIGTVSGPGCRDPGCADPDCRDPRHRVIGPE